MFSFNSIGILGGGQLGAMLLRSAIDFGLPVTVLDKDANAAAARFTAHFSPGDPANYEDVMALGRSVDVLTIEKENVNTQALHDLEKMGKSVFPSSAVLNIIQDKFIQKEFLLSLDVPVAKGWLIADKKNLANYAHRLPAILKKCRNGYDGYGVMKLNTEADFANAFSGTCLLEESIDIAQEISVIVARSTTGDVACYDPVTMVFSDTKFVLTHQLAPAQLPDTLAQQATALAEKIATEIDLAGIMAVEMFVTAAGRLLVNELAPRPHNSGHHTIEGCATSQYEQHLRAILGLPLGPAVTTTPTIMLNILEPAENNPAAMSQKLTKILALPHAHLHWYGKTPGRPGRKIGHVTIAAHAGHNFHDTAEAVRQILNKA